MSVHLTSSAAPNLQP